VTADASLDHLYMVVSDLERSVRFYGGALGLGVERWGDGYVRIRGDEGFFIGMEERPPQEVGGRGIEIVVRVDDVDRRYQELIAAGVRFTAPPADQEWGARHAWLRDPDGYPVSIFSSFGGAPGDSD
jgi:catechol 2,3-dioxygenase-like lactoylglutathione lyase family enzyme